MMSWHRTTERPHTVPLPVSTLRACRCSALPPLSSLESMATPTPTRPIDVKKRLSSLSIRHHHPTPPLFQAPSQRQTWLSGHEHRPKWPLFTCTICCSVRVPSVLDQPGSHYRPSTHLRRQGNSSECPPPTSAALTCAFQHARPYPHPLSPF